MAIHYLYSQSAGTTPNWHEKQTRVYKYLSFFDAVCCLNKKTFWFSNPAKWKDPYERFFLTARYEGNEGDYNPYPYNVLCFCVRDNPNCEAAWRMYGNDTVRFRIPLKKLVERISETVRGCDIYVGKAVYKKRDDIKKVTLEYLRHLFLDNGKAADPYIASLFIKRESFCYESEIRILIRYPKDENLGAGREISFGGDGDCRDIVQHILLAPDTERPAQKKEFFCEQYGYSTGEKASVQKSSLYDRVTKCIIKRQ